MVDLNGRKRLRTSTLEEEYDADSAIINAAAMGGEADELFTHNNRTSDDRISSINNDDSSVYDEMMSMTSTESESESYDDHDDHDFDDSNNNSHEQHHHNYQYHQQQQRPQQQQQQHGGVAVHGRAGGGGAAIVPAGFLCPLTMEIMFDPVLDADGNTYERRAILEWLRENRTSPISRQPLSERMIIPNNALREVIHECMGSTWVATKMQEAAAAATSTTMLASSPTTTNTTTTYTSGVGMNGITRSQYSRPRDRIDCFLQHTSRELGGLSLKLNEQGCCAFRYDGITIVLDVPERVGVFCLYTRNLIPDFPDNVKDQIKSRALELNFLQGDTRGGCLSIRKHDEINREEVMFSYTDRVPEVAAKDFSNILLNFVETSVTLRCKLLAAMKPPPRPPARSSPPSPPQVTMSATSNPRSAAAVAGGGSNCTGEKKQDAATAAVAAAATAAMLTAAASLSSGVGGRTVTTTTSSAATSNRGTKTTAITNNATAA